MTCIREVKAAALGIRAAQEDQGAALPLVVSMAFSESGRLLTGSDIEGAAAMLTAMDGVDALGLNCQNEPKALIPNLQRLLACAGGKPVLFKPNAGIPELIHGCTVFKTEADVFARDMAEAVKLGAHAVGGCCGTTDAHLAALVRAASGLPYAPPAAAAQDGLAPCAVSGYSKTVFIGARPVIIGERLNPTGKPPMKQALRAGDMDYIEREAAAQIDAGADILDVNVGLPELDEAAVLKAVTEAVQAVVPAPLQLDSASPAALEAALRACIGKPVVNSVSGKQSVMDAVFPLAKRYGAALVALCLDENGIPETADGRVAIAERILLEADKHGIDHSNILFDALTMAAAADPAAPSVTLETVRRLRGELGVKTVLGVSNVSFGLPNRSMITAAFLSMALDRGLSAAILNPLDPQVLSAFYAARATLGHDEGFARFIGKFSSVTVRVSGKAEESGAGKGGDGSLRETIIAGLENPADAAAAALIAGGVQPLAVIEEHVIPALAEVGARYESGKIFLPQLIQSANAAKRAIAEATAHLPPAAPKPDKTVVMATVEGDVHDIGKNIVCTMLSSYGFHVVDLGRNVPPAAVLAALKQSGARLLGLSALMTTTVPSMRDTIALVRREHPGAVRIMVGGAVLTPALALEIGADYYAADAMASVRIAKEALEDGRR
jgi:5-methyltetrahydrofolate--homocysteine methyltransferase